MHRNTVRLLVTTLVMLGLLTLGLTRAVAQEQFTIDQTTVNPQTGEVTLTGTVTCSAPVHLGVYGSLSQQIGPNRTVQGSFSQGVECPGPEGTTVSITITPDEGRFIPGEAELIVRMAGCMYNPELGYCTRVGFHLLTTVRLTPAP
jgi:hypothetical protein